MAPLSALNLLSEDKSNHRADPLSPQKEAEGGKEETLDVSLELPTLPAHYTIAGFRVHGSRVLPSRLIRHIEKALLSKHQTPSSSSSTPSSSSVPLSAEENAALVRAFLAQVNSWYIENGYLFARLVPRPHFLSVGNAGDRPKESSLSAKAGAEVDEAEKRAPAFLLTFDCAEPLVADPPLQITFLERRLSESAPHGSEVEDAKAEDAQPDRHEARSRGACLVETTGRLKPEVVAKHLRLVPGRPFKWDAERWQRAATESDLFEDAQASAVVLPGNEGIRVEVIALEKPVYSFRPGVSFSSALRDVEGQVSLEHRNVGGSSARARLALRLAPSFDFVPRRGIPTRAEGAPGSPGRPQSSSLSADLLFNSLSRATDQEFVRLSMSASSEFLPPPVLPSSPSRTTPSLPSSSLLSRVLAASSATPETPIPGVSTPLPAASHCHPQKSTRLLLPAGHFCLGVAASGEKRLGHSGTLWGEATVERRKGLYVHLTGVDRRTPREGDGAANNRDALKEGPRALHAENESEKPEDQKSEAGRSWRATIRNTFGKLRPSLSSTPSERASATMVAADDVASLLPSPLSGSIFSDPSVAHDVAKVAGGLRFKFSSGPSTQLALPTARLPTTWAFEASSFAGVYTPYTASDAEAAFSPLSSSPGTSGDRRPAPSKATSSSCPPRPGVSGLTARRRQAGDRRDSSFSFAALVPSPVSSLAKLLPKRLTEKTRFSRRVRELRRAAAAAMASVSPLVCSRAREAAVWTRSAVLGNLPFAPRLFPSFFASASPSSLYSSPPLPYCGFSLALASRAFPLSSLFPASSPPASCSSPGRFKRVLTGCLASVLSSFNFAQLAVSTRLNVDLLLPPRLLLPLLSGCLSPSSASASSASAPSSLSGHTCSLRGLLGRGRCLLRLLHSQASSYLSACRTTLSSAEALHESLATSLPSSASLYVLPRLSLCAFPVFCPASAAPASEPPLPAASAPSFAFTSEPASTSARCSAAPSETEKPVSPDILASLPSHADRRRFLAASLRAAAARYPSWEMVKLTGKKGNRLRGWGSEPVGIFEAVAEGSFELSVPIVARLPLGRGRPRLPLKLMEVAVFFDHSVGFSPFLLPAASPSPPSAAAAATAAAARALGSTATPTAVGDTALGSSALTGAAERASGPGGSRPLLFLAQAKQRLLKRGREVGASVAAALERGLERTGWSVCHWPSVGVCVRLALLSITFARPVRIRDDGVSLHPGRFFVGMVDDSL
ncbi:conserved hypothetical protein [Neospora caninum Liverpool]|uniref:Uncharacterized protein n=1 Tax=Neospora caninum (strain Liverpool) TaxID=572307 RepID=F0VIZ9_NEOCL|nr:conserved hypothetical protein [Neospora caninum Liverpool]CBZ53710.1 conserved hypothetical protein [Neospora caninum Liverpool]|eukprot:XP_003883742.1 conserved hypothetical protein [Neospora caninum Liverpool]